MPDLALHGGKPVRTRPLPPWPYFEDDEIAAACAVLRSGKVNYWTGDEGQEFENEFADLCGSRHAVAVSNGTVALELALEALELRAGDEVVVPCRTFIASASAVVRVGAQPILADIDGDSQNLTADTIRPVLTDKTRAIVAVHLAGWPCEMDGILELASGRGLFVIEDCAQAHGARYRGRPVGGIGDIGAFSFCQDKIMTTGGEGGMIVTSDEARWRRIWSLKDHGKSYEAVFEREHPPGYRWLHNCFGTNARMTEMQAALGRAQLRKLGAWVEVRRAHAARLNACCRQFPALRVTQPPPDVYHSYYKYHVFVEPQHLREDWSRDRIMEAISAEGIPCRMIGGGGPQIQFEEAFGAHPQGGRPLPVAQALHDRGLSFLVHPTLTDEDLIDACHAVEKVLGAASI